MELQSWGDGALRASGGGGGSGDDRTRWSETGYQVVRPGSAMDINAFAPAQRKGTPVLSIFMYTRTCVESQWMQRVSEEPDRQFKLLHLTWIPFG